jgi:hypothetical protein
MVLWNAGIRARLQGTLFGLWRAFASTLYRLEVGIARWEGFPGDGRGRRDKAGGTKAVSGWVGRGFCLLA